MAYERLTQLLSKIEKKPVEICAAFVFKFGNLLLAEELPRDDEPYQFSAREGLEFEPWEPPSKILEEIKRGLECHPNVFHLHDLDVSPELSVVGTRTGMLVEGPIYTMEIQLPKGRQHFQDGDVSEHFTVIWSGSPFAAYTAIEDIPLYTNIAHEFRELARNQIEESTRYKAPLFGPCPVSTDIIVVVANTPDITTTQALRSYEHHGTLYLVIDEHIHVTKFMQQLFDISHMYWEGYYELILERSESIEMDIEIQNRFSEASQAVNTMAITPSWKVWKTSKLATLAALEIGQMYKLVVQYDEACWRYDNQRREYLKRICDIPHLSKLRRYTAEDCQRDFRTPSSITAALEFLEKQIETARNIRSLVLASLLGAVVGAVITGVLSLIKTK